MRKFDKYTKNLCVVNDGNADWIQSYKTKVARIDYGNKTAEVTGWFSMTTSKHINYACKELGLEQIKGERS